MCLPAIVSLLLAVLPAALAAQRPVTRIDVIPLPVSWTPRSGAFTLTAATAIHTDSATLDLGRQLAGYLAPATGFPFAVRLDGAAGSGIDLGLDPALRRLGAEGYTLDVSRKRIVIRAAGRAGLFYGIQTLRQLLPVAIFRAAPVEGVAWTVPALRIEDYPRFSWRGAHLDACRHFMPKEFVKKYLDLLALHKLNTFHWHLTDDQGWRIEIRKYPRLTEVGAWRSGTLIGRYTPDSTQWQFDGERHGGFYTQDDIREIVAYAGERFINVVPEIEMPGHSVAAIAAYPELGVTGESTAVAQHWGVFDNILSPDDSTVHFMEDVLAEVLALFPSTFIHIGGDEADKARWKASPRVQERLRELGLQNEDELQSWFIRQIDSFLSAHGRRLVGWDEILDGGLAPGATVMSWRGEDGGLTAARAGHDVVMAPGRWTYFDHYQSADKDAEPLAIGGFLPLDTVYAYEPVPRQLAPEFRGHILGAQGQLWTEYIATPKQAEYMAFPRLSALAEVLWTPPARKNYAGFLSRLETHLKRLTILDVNFHPLSSP